jgi:hypothetical protein
MALRVSRHTRLPPLRRHQHDVHNIVVTVMIEVIAWLIAALPARAEPPAGHQHDIHHVHIASAIEVTEETPNGNLI